MAHPVRTFEVKGFPGDEEPGEIGLEQWELPGPVEEWQTHKGCLLYQKNLSSHGEYVSVLGYEVTRRVDNGRIVAVVRFLTKAEKKHVPKRLLKQFRCPIVFW